MKILLLGATGLVGKNVLTQALVNSAITGVVAPTRRPLTPHPKLVNPVSGRLESLLGTTEGVDGVVCALGTTIGKAGKARCNPARASACGMGAARHEMKLSINWVIASIPVNAVPEAVVSSVWRPTIQSVSGQSASSDSTPVAMTPL